MRLSLYQLWFELKRRKVVQALVAYGALSWLVLQITDVASDGLDLPAWTFRLVMLVLVLGLPVVLALAWIFDFGPGGLVRTGDAASKDNSLLAVVLALHIQQLHNANERPALAALQRKLLTAPSIWRRWLPDGAIVVLPDARQALLLATELQQLQQAIGCEGRVGLALGEVHFHDDRVAGDAVRVAEVLARHGSAAITGSEAVNDALREESAAGSRLLGPLQHESLSHPVRAYALQWVSDAATPAELAVARLRWAWLLLPLLLVIGWWQWGRAVSPASDVALPSAPLPAAVSYLQIQTTLDPIAGSAHLRQAMSRLAPRVLERIPGLYLAESDNRALANHQLALTLEQRDGQLIVSAQLTATAPHSLSVSATQRWQRPPEQLQQLLDEVETGLSRWLAQQFQLGALNLPVSAPVPAEIFAAFLEAERALQQAQSVAEYEQVMRSVEAITVQAPAFADASLLGCQAGIYLHRNADAAHWLEPTDRHCDSALRSPAARADMLVAAAKWRRLRGDEPAAIRLLEQALKQQPLHSNGLSELASLHADAGNDIDAEHIYRRAIQLQPSYWPPYRALAFFQLSRGRFQDAAQNYRKVIELTPPNARAYSDLGAALFMSGELQAAADAFQLSLQQQDDADTASNLATLYYYLGRMTEAVQLYRQALAKQSGKALLHANLADALWQSGDRAAAAKSYVEALQLIRQEQQAGALDAQLQAVAAHAALRLGEREQADQFLQQALTLAPNNPEVQFRAAVIALQRGERQQALQYLQQAQQRGYPAKLLAVDPDLANLATEPAFLALLSERR